MSIEPDTKDWTWVLDRPCPDCSFDATKVSHESVAATLRATSDEWGTQLARSDVRRRTRVDRWSVLEYGCHVRDTFEVFDNRVVLMLTCTNPMFENWDQDQTSRDRDYSSQVPGEVALQLAANATALADRFDSVTGATWERTGTRSNGSRFTIATLAVYLAHDPIHHLWDVASP
jgi:DinB superfamily